VDDTFGALVHGFLVLSDATITAGMLGRDGMTAVRSTRVAPENINACFDLYFNRVAPKTYAGLGSTLTNWARSEGATGQISLRLLHAPDAFHNVTATAVGGEFSGTGRSIGFGRSAPPPDWSDDIVVGRRIGDVDMSRCVAGVSQHAARKARELTPPLLTSLRASPATAADLRRKAADPLHRFVFWFGHMLQRGSELPGFAPTAAAWGAEEILAQPDITVIVPTGAAVAASMYADSALAQIAELVALGVPASAVTLVGAGFGAAVAAEIVARVREPVSVVFVGDCRGFTGVRPADHAPVHTFEVADADSPPGARCAEKTGAPASHQELLLPRRSDGLTLMSMPPAAELEAAAIYQRGIPPRDLRQDDWLDPVVRWIKARRAPPISWLAPR
jgi:hypothetical protein